MTIIPIIWTGLGFLVAVFVFGFSLLCNLASNAYFGPAYWDAHGWPFGASLLVSATVCWIAGKRLSKRASMTVIDKATGQEMVLDRGKHSLFFIPMHIWAPILAICGCLVCAIDFVR
jgi:hypothetical protein